MRIAITGATGRIGNVVVRQLLQQGHTVRVLLRREHASLAGLPLEKVQGDLSRPETLDALMQGCDAAIHLAALISIQGPMGGALGSTNVVGTDLVLKAALRARLRRLVCFSSIHAFRQSPQHEPLDETRPLAFGSKMAYDRSKAQALSLTLAFAQAHPELEVLAVCPTSVIGPLDFGPSLSGKMFLDFYQGKIPMLVPGGFDWCDVRDVAAAAVSALTRGRSGEAYLLGGHYCTMPQLAEMVHRSTGRPVSRRVAPWWLLRVGLPFVWLYGKITRSAPLYTAEAIDTLREGAFQVVSDKARRELGYNTRPLEETVADAYAWFKEQGMLQGKG